MLYLEAATKWKPRLKYTRVHQIGQHNIRKSSGRIISELFLKHEERAPGCGGTKDSHHRCAANKPAATVDVIILQHPRSQAVQ